MGAQQVGKAAIAGWKELLQPAHRQGEIAIWPFSGPLLALLQPGSTTVVETYPAEFMAQFIQSTSIAPPARLSKRSSCSRMEAGRLLFEQAQQHGIVLSDDLSTEIRSGFGPKPDGEDAFDAAIGLLGMLATLQNWHARPDPAAGMPAWLSVEGWIFGQPWQICPDQNPV
jgi:hypothetical protein